MKDEDLDNLVEAIESAETEASSEIEGYHFFNGVRHVGHPRDCDCRDRSFRFGSHCWCCGYLQSSGQCKCDSGSGAGICIKCGKCPAHCRCKTKASSSVREGSESG
jgi:hypothetical protein